jgi:predicted dehydrogenase
MGMIGGGLDAFIGAVHRRAAALDGEIELVCGAFSSDPAKSKATGKSLHLDPKRIYGSFSEMIQKEKQLPEGERMDFVSIVTPNHVHFEPAKQALENGFHVIIDKPLAFSVAEGKVLKKIVEKSGLILALTHTYTGYPLVKEARHAIANGKIGKVRKVYVEYPQGKISVINRQVGELIRNVQELVGRSATSVHMLQTWPSISQDFRSLRSMRC